MGNICSNTHLDYITNDTATKNILTYSKKALTRRDFTTMSKFNILLLQIDKNRDKLLLLQEYIKEHMYQDLLTLKKESVFIKIAFNLLGLKLDEKLVQIRVKSTYWTDLLRRCISEQEDHRKILSQINSNYSQLTKTSEIINNEILLLEKGL